MELENNTLVPYLENINEYRVNIQDIPKPKPVYMKTHEENTKVLIYNDTNGVFIEKLENERLSNQPSPHERFSNQSSPCERLSNQPSPRERFSNLQLLDERLSKVESPCERFSNLQLPHERLSKVESPCEILLNQKLPDERLSKVESPCEILLSQKLPSKVKAKCFNFLSKKKICMEENDNLSKKNSKLININPYIEEKDNSSENNLNLEIFKELTDKHYNYISTNQSILEIKLFKNKRSYKRWSFFIIFTSSLLTVIEVIIKQYNIKENEKITSIYSNTILLLPLFLSFIITLTSAWIKNIKFEEIIENVTRAIEKSITAKSKLEKINEELIFNTDININQNKDEAKKTYDDMTYRYYNDVYKNYLDAQELCDRNINVKEFPKFLKTYLTTKKKILKYEKRYK